MKDQYQELSDYLDVLVGLVDTFPGHIEKMNEIFQQMMEKANAIGGKVLEDTTRLQSAYKYLLTSPQQTEQLLVEFKKDCFTLKNDLWAL
jgi:hypothetical protein